MKENKIVLTPYGEDGYKEYVAVIQKDKSIKLVPVEEFENTGGENK